MLIRYVFENMAINNDYLPVDLYPCCETSLKTSLKERDQICLNQITSTTSSIKEAKQFKNGKIVTTFVIQGTTRSDHKILPISTHSKFPYEKEFLVTPFQIYTVKSIERRSDGVIVKLELY